MAKKSEWTKKREKAFKKFNPIFKKAKKEIIKAAKEFECFDYGYMEKLIFNCIKIYKEFYSNPDLLVQDTTSEMNKYPDMLYSLNKCCVIIDKIENCEYSTFQEEEQLKIELYDTIKQYHMSWWD